MTPNHGHGSPGTYIHTTCSRSRKYVNIVIERDIYLWHLPVLFTYPIMWVVLLNCFGIFGNKKYGTPKKRQCATLLSLSTNYETYNGSLDYSIVHPGRPEREMGRGAKYVWWAQSREARSLQPLATPCIGSVGSRCEAPEGPREEFPIKHFRKTFSGLSEAQTPISYGTLINFYSSLKEERHFLPP